MANEILKINYPSIYIGTESSEIEFFDGTPDLVSIFNIGAENTGKRYFVTDGTVASLPCMENFLSKFEDDRCNNDYLIILGSGEPYKTVESVLKIVSAAIEAGFSRNDLFVGIGGGVICDITAFAASIFKRGAKVEFVPTTLLAMVDAAMGGKTGCDFDNYKNMIGSFYPARKIYYCTDFVQSLSEQQFNSGLAEAFKTAILSNAQMLDVMETESEKIKARDSKILKNIIMECVKIKSSFVEKDFTERNIRAFLNLGHTYGHALETLSGLGAITHGQAVAWGIGRATVLSLNKGYCMEAFKNKIFKILELYDWNTESIPSSVAGGAIGERFLTVMHKDKKNMNSKIKVVIPKNTCDIVAEEVEDSEILATLK
ncbi:MAG: 3-dehydroquinate synthase [Treponema sp.]|nr:3-dehydroquinate synthase [Treponema sp.]